jgi:hypothetical protein
MKKLQFVTLGRQTKWSSIYNKKGIPNRLRNSWWNPSMHGRCTSRRIIQCMHIRMYLCEGSSKVSEYLVWYSVRLLGLLTPPPPTTPPTPPPPPQPLLWPNRNGPRGSCEISEWLTDTSSLINQKNGGWRHGADLKCLQRWNSWTVFLVEISGHINSFLVFYPHFSVLRSTFFLFRGFFARFSLKSASRRECE